MIWHLLVVGGLYAWVIYGLYRWHQSARSLPPPPLGDDEQTPASGTRILPAYQRRELVWRRDLRGRWWLE